MDEKGFMIGVALRWKVICRKSLGAGRLTHDRSREWIIVMQAVWGDGRGLWPMIINKGPTHYMR